MTHRRPLEILMVEDNTADLRLAQEAFMEGRIPVVIVTTSRAQADIFQSYDLHANCYIVKPIDLDEFIKVIHSPGNFWFSTATLPTLSQ